MKEVVLWFWVFQYFWFQRAPTCKQQVSNKQHSCKGSCGLLLAEERKENILLTTHVVEWRTRGTGKNGHLHRTSHICRFQKSSHRNKQAVLHTRPFCRIGIVNSILGSQNYDRRANIWEALHDHNLTNKDFFCLFSVLIIKDIGLSFRID